MTGAYEGPPWEGGGYFNITSACISQPQAIYILHCIALHSPKLKIKKRNKMYSDSQQYPSMSDQVLHLISMFPILKIDYFYLWFLYQSDSRISCFRNDGEMKGSKVHGTGLSINGGSLKIACIPFKYNYIV